MPRASERSLAGSGLQSCWLKGNSNPSGMVSPSHSTQYIDAVSEKSIGSLGPGKSAAVTSGKNAGAERCVFMGPSRNERLAVLAHGEAAGTVEMGGDDAPGYPKGVVNYVVRTNELPPLHMQRHAEGVQYFRIHEDLFKALEERLSQGGR